MTETQKREILFNDEPISTIDNDLLQVETHMKGFSKFIRTCETPLTISIQGKWGSGKTSFFQLVRENIEKDQMPKDIKKEENEEDQIKIQGNSETEIEKSERLEKESWDKCCFLTFNAWQFSQFNSESDLPVALIASLTDQLEKMMDSSNDNRASSTLNTSAQIDRNEVDADNLGEKKGRRGLFKKLRKAVSAALTIGNIYVEKKYGVNIKKEIDDASSKYKDIDEDIDGFFENVSILSELKSEFSSSVSDTLEKKFGKATSDNKNASRMIVFIDDLDRLPPEKAVDLLDTIKLFLDSPKCIFVLAVDYEVVLRGVEIKYKDVLETKKRHDYFEKMIQVVYKLPSSMQSLKGYLASVANRFGFNRNFAKDLVKFAEVAGKDNPRGIKRLLNNYKLITTINENDIKKIKQSDTANKLSRSLFGLLCVSESEPKIYEEINNSFNEKLNSVLYKYFIQKWADDNICTKTFINWFIGITEEDKNEVSIKDENDFELVLYDNNREILIYALQMMNYSYDSNSEISVGEIVFELSDKDKAFVNEEFEEFGKVKAHDYIRVSLETGTKEDAYVSTIKWLLDHCIVRTKENVDKIDDMIGKFHDLWTLEKEHDSQKPIVVGEQGKKLYINMYDNIDDYTNNIKKIAEEINITVIWKGYNDDNSINNAEEEGPTAGIYLDVNNYLSDFAVISEDAGFIG